MTRLDDWLNAAPPPAPAPLVTLTYAQSLDGSITSARGQPLQISGPEAMTLTHRLRAAHDAILVGIGTVLADNPRLTVRLAPGEHPQPVVLDSRLRFPLDAALLGGPRRPWIACGPVGGLPAAAALEQAGARLLPFPLDDAGRVPLPALLARLGEQGIRSLMVEGGAAVIAAFLRQRLAQRVLVTIAPVFVGGLPAVEAGALLPGGLRLDNPGIQRAGDDIIVWGSIKTA